MQAAWQAGAAGSRQLHKPWQHANQDVLELVVAGTADNPTWTNPGASKAHDLMSHAATGACTKAAAHLHDSVCRQCLRQDS